MCRDQVRSISRRIVIEGVVAAVHESKPRNSEGEKTREETKDVEIKVQCESILQETPVAHVEKQKDQ